MFGTPEQAAAFRAACKKDPLLFARKVWGRKRWEGQRRIRQALATFSLVVIFGGNGIGKTSELAAYIIEDVVLNPGTRWTLAGPKFKAIKKNIFGEIRSLYADALREGIDLGGRMNDAEWVLGERWDVEVMTADDPNAYQGRRGKRRTRVCIDEAQGDIDVSHWRALDSLTTAAGSQFVANGNPLTSGGYFRSIATDASLGWHPVQLSVLDHPNIKEGREVIPQGPTRQWVEQKRARGVKDPEYIARVEGRFPPSAPNQLISEDWIIAGARAYAAALIEEIKRQVLADLRGIRIGMDVSYGGDDLCVVSALKDGVLVDQEEWGHETRTDVSAGRLLGFAQRQGVEKREAWRIKVDAAAGGAGVVSECQRLGWDVDPVNFGEGPAGDWPDITADMELRNRRCELHWVMARLVEEGAIVIPTDPENHDRYLRTRQDLLTPRYDYPNSVFTVEKKELIKKRIGHSPDHGDSIAIALSNTGSGGLGLTWRRPGA